MTPHVDPVPRAVVHGGKPVRHVGKPERNVDEVAASGFEILHGGVDASETADRDDDLLVVARTP